MKYRTIWISDTHLGSVGCQAEKLLKFLKEHESDTLILVGDIIDFWALRRKPYWPESHNTVVQKILKKARHGTRVIYIPGNHDEPLRNYLELTFGSIELHREYTHTLADSRQILCVHGDDFDVITRYHRWVAKLGDVGYDVLLWSNRQFNKARFRLGLGYWSLSAFIKHKVKQAVSFIGEYEESVVKEALTRGVDGVLCGHIHHAEIRHISDILYLNTGDWVESCTAIVEHYDGKLEIIHEV
jgi:UDP-2,3-diacylglucosamine pyrophosphatase LpxH